ncbi:MAG: helix-turn-helix transcriptional regulator [Chloroflexi bacterium]|nr:helix-turn-helix transcriptional regulator [Chloroflexota bacterium]
MSCTHPHALFQQAGDYGSALLAANELAWLRGLHGDYAGMQLAALAVAHAAAAEREPFAELQALHATGFAAFVRGLFSQADAALDRSNAIASQERRIYRLTVGYTIRACNLAACGRPGLALPLIDSAKALDPDWRDSILPEWQTIVHWFAGKFRSALVCARDAEARAIGELSKRRAIGVIFGALRNRSRPGFRGRTDLERAKGAVNIRDWQFFSYFLGHAEGLLAWHAGAVSEALAILQQTAARVLATGAEPFAAVVLIDVTEAAAACGDGRAARDSARQLQDIADHIDCEFYHALTAMAYGWAGDLGAAQRAVDILSVSSCKAYSARASGLLGRILLESNRGEALEWLEQAALTFDSCGAVWRRDRIREKLKQLGARGRKATAASLGPSGLSPRERQVALLAAQGQSARNIADELLIGERTIETHLANVYAKLGVRSKTDLVRRASELLNQ